MAELRLKIEQKDQNLRGRHLAIFLHGLGAPDTWENATSDWKKTILADASLKDVDVGIVTYDTALLVSGLLKKIGVKNFSVGNQKVTVDDQPFSDIEMLAREFKQVMDSRQVRPYEKIVLIGHSMGGLIAFRYLLEEIEHGEMLRVHGYVSLATPFNGSDKASFHKIIQRWQEHAQIGDLAPNSDFLDDTIRLYEKHFHFQSPALDEVQFTFCFGKEDTIVSEKSAIPHPHYSLWRSGVPLPGDHGGILSLAQGGNSKAYETVQERILDVIDPLPPSPQPTHRNVYVHQKSSTEQGSSSHDQGRGTVTNKESSPYHQIKISTPVLFKSCESKMDRFVNLFPSESRDTVQEARQEVYKKITALDPEEFLEFCFRHRFPRNSPHMDSVALLELWQVLTILELSYPDWHLDGAEEIANLRLEEEVWRRWIYSVEQETMPDLLLQLAKRRLIGPSGRYIKLGEADLFPHRLILANCNRDVQEEIICEHCQSKNDISFERVLRDTGRAEELTVFKGIQSNGYGSLDQVKVTCANCIRGVRKEKTVEEIRKRIKEVV